MQSQNKYIGDDKFIKMLEHYSCSASLDVVKLRFAGAICSPNLNLRPTDVISSLWEENKQPRLQTKEEAELFFKFIMGLWDDIFAKVKNSQISLPLFKIKDKADLKNLCLARYEQIEAGFLEGFWGGQQNLQIPAFIAQIIDSLNDLAEIYMQLQNRSVTDSEFENLIKTINHTDKMVNASFDFIIKNFVLPRFEKLSNSIN
jgi:uncharacterized protein YecA (UPF0149 family)